MYQYNILKRLSNTLMYSGKRTVSDKIIEDVATILKENGYAEPYKSMVEAINTLKPRVELRTQKKSGQRIQVPSAMTASRQEGLALRMLKEASVNRKKGQGGSFSNHLAQEFIGILRSNIIQSNIRSQVNVSQSLTKRDTLHRMAIAQRGALR